MKILCLCRKGNSRSVALVWILKEKMGHEAIATGMEVISKETKEMLCDWAEVIILVLKKYKYQIPAKYQHKLKVWDVGPDTYPDIYFRGFDKRLIRMFNDYIKSEWKGD